jgi:hypothetical protein
MDVVKIAKAGAVKELIKVHAKEKTTNGNVPIQISNSSARKSSNCI